MCIRDRCQIVQSYILYIPEAGNYFLYSLMHYNAFIIGKLELLKELQQPVYVKAEKFMYVFAAYLDVQGILTQAAALAFVTDGLA